MASFEALPDLAAILGMALGLEMTLFVLLFAWASLVVYRFTKSMCDLGSGIRKLQPATASIADVPEVLVIRILASAHRSGAFRLRLALVSRRWTVLTCQSVKTLRLSGSQVEAALQTGFSEYPFLRRLRLEECPLTSFPPDFGSSSLKSLEVLKLVDSDHISSLPCSLHELTRLKVLQLDNLEALETIPSCFGCLTSLHTITISWCPELKELPDSISRLTNLTKLESDVPTKGIPQAVQSLPNLVMLRLSNEGIVEDSTFPNITTDMPKLKRFSFQEEFDDVRAVHLSATLSRVSRLEHLDLDGIWVQGSLPAFLGDLPRLAYLRISCEHLHSLPRGFEALKTLDLEVRNQAPELSGDALSYYSFYYLEVLNLRGGFERLPSAVGQLKALKTLSLEDVENLIELPESISGLRSLRQLCLRDAKALASLPTTLTNITGLRELKIGGALKSIPVSLAWRLDILDVSYCKDLEKLESSAGPLHVKKLCTSCIQLSNGSDWGRILKGVHHLDVKCSKWSWSLTCTGCRVPDAIGSLPGLAILHLPRCILHFSPHMALLTNLSSLEWETRGLEEQPQRAQAVAQSAMALLKLPKLSQHSKSALKKKCLHILKV